jgi:GNAT superfamily N-acetyltransferase
MEISVRPATSADVATIVDLYRIAEAEQTTKKPIWALTDGLDLSFEDSVERALAADESWVLVGLIDGVIVGFLWATLEDMLSRAEGARIGFIRLVYTEPEARGVGVGHQMLETIMDQLRTMGIRHFDATAGPGQRATKNFFEGHEFAARSLIMHHEDPADA